MTSSGNRVIYRVGNTHFDPVWLWTWDEGMSSIRSTFRAALDQMEGELEFIAFTLPDWNSIELARCGLLDIPPQCG